MNDATKTLMRNAGVTVAAFALGYLVLSGTMVAEFQFSRAGEMFRSAARGEQPDLPDGENPFEDMRRSVNRIRYLYVPTAILISAALIATFSLRWHWSWLLTSLGCGYGLASLAFVCSSNSGYGIAIALAAYVMIASLVTFVVYLRERSDPPSVEHLAPVDHQADPDIGIK